MHRYIVVTGVFDFTQHGEAVSKIFLHLMMELEFMDGKIHDDGKMNSEAK